MVTQLDEERKRLWELAKANFDTHQHQISYVFFTMIEIYDMVATNKTCHNNIGVSEC